MTWIRRELCRFGAALIAISSCHAPVASAPTVSSTKSESPAPLHCFGPIAASRPLLLCTRRDTGGPTELGMVGCMRAAPTAFVVPGDAGGAITTRAELARYLGVDSALAARHYAQIALGQSWYEELAGFRGSAVAIGFGRYRVELFYRQSCGCDHHVARVTLEVSSDGALKELNRTPVPTSASHACVD